MSLRVSPKADDAVFTICHARMEVVALIGKERFQMSSAVSVSR